MLQSGTCPWLEKWSTWMTFKAARTLFEDYFFLYHVVTISELRTWSGQVFSGNWNKRRHQINNPSRLLAVPRRGEVGGMVLQEGDADEEGKLIPPLVQRSSREAVLLFGGEPLSFLGSSRWRKTRTPLGGSGGVTSGPLPTTPANPDRSTQLAGLLVILYPLPSSQISASANFETDMFQHPIKIDHTHTNRISTFYLPLSIPFTKELWENCIHFNRGMVIIPQIS